MTDDRFTKLEIAVAVQEERLDQLSEALKANTEAMVELTASLNKSKGAVWVLGALLTILTSFGAWIGLR